MRKLILISAFVLASVLVQAVEARELILAASDAPAAAATAAAATATPAAPAVTADNATPQASTPQASRKQASRSKQIQVRRENDEQKARRIAARYGISW